MKCHTETQAFLTGEGACRRLCGRIAVSHMNCGSVVQIHIRNLPCDRAFACLCIELRGGSYPLPGLPISRGEALMSVYTAAFTPEDTVGCRVVLTGENRGACREILACGRLSPCFSPDCCPPDPRPLFAAPIRRLPGESTFY